MHECMNAPAKVRDLRNVSISNDGWHELFLMRGGAGDASPGGEPGPSHLVRHALPGVRRVSRRPVSIQRPGATHHILHDQAVRGPRLHYGHGRATNAQHHTVRVAIRSPHQPHGMVRRRPRVCRRLVSNSHAAPEGDPFEGAGEAQIWRSPKDVNCVHDARTTTDLLFCSVHVL